MTESGESKKAVNSSARIRKTVHPEDGRKCTKTGTSGDPRNLLALTHSERKRRKEKVTAKPHGQLLKVATFSFGVKKNSLSKEGSARFP